MPKALQEWTEGLSVMQQSVLISAVRGPDTIKKDHVAKLLLRWLRRCILVSAFDGAVLPRPYDVGEPQGGSFTGPSIPYTGTYCAHPDWWVDDMDDLIEQYLRCVDELPHHFQLHFMHAAEIIGYKHPDPVIREWWLATYLKIVNDAHLYPENEAQLDWRLADNEEQWRAREVVTAIGPAHG